MEESRICTACHITKPIDRFGKDKRHAGGRRRQCKECRRAAYLARTTPEQRRETFAAYRATPVGQEACNRGNRKWRKSAKGRAYYQRPEFLEYNRQKVARYRERNPEKVAARNAVRSAKKRGDLKPARNCLCSYCGHQAHDYHHYKGYAPEHHLTVVPICKVCHQRAEEVAHVPGQVLVGRG
jgi:hypothetical protein